MADGSTTLTSAQACVPLSHTIMYTHKLWPPNSCVHAHVCAHTYKYIENKQKGQDHSIVQTFLKYLVRWAGKSAPGPASELLFVRPSSSPFHPVQNRWRSGPYTNLAGDTCVKWRVPQDKERKKVSPVSWHRRWKYLMPPLKSPGQGTENLSNAHS